MPLEVQFKLKSNPLYIKYLRENSHWYKRLIRNPESFKEMIEELKINYKLRPTDKINKLFDTVNIISNLFNNMV